MLKTLKKKKYWAFVIKKKQNLGFKKRKIETQRSQGFGEER